MPETMTMQRARAASTPGRFSRLMPPMQETGGATRVWTERMS
jgi:hypothetical protein